MIGGACGVMVIVVGNGHSDPSSNPGRGFNITLDKSMDPTTLPPTVGK